MRQHSALQELPELAFHKAGNNAIAFTLSGEKGFQMSGDKAIERVVFRIAKPVAVDSHSGIAGCILARNSLHNRLNNFRTGHHG